MEISDIFTPEGIEKIKVGQILVFDNDKGKTELKITKIDRKNKKVYAKETITFSPNEVSVLGKRNFWGKRKVETLEENINEK
jgi:hypothetical protein